MNVRLDVRYCLFVTTLAVLSACGGGGGGGKPVPPRPEVVYGTNRMGGQLLDISVVDNAATLAAWTYFVDVNHGFGYWFRVKPIVSTPTLLRFSIPLGKVDPFAGVVTGSIEVHVVRMNSDGGIAFSPWHTLDIGQLTGGFFPPPGTVAQSAVMAARSLDVHGMGDAWLVDEGANGQLDFDSVLQKATLEVDGFDFLWGLVERAKNGEVISFGNSPSGPILFEAASLPHVDRLVGTLDGAIAKGIGALPPNPQALVGMYQVAAHDVSHDAADSIRIACGAARFSLELYEKALMADGGSVAILDSSTKGAIAWFNAFSTGFASALLMDALPAQAGTSQGTFAIARIASEEGFLYMQAFALDHFGPEASFGEPVYGTELAYAGRQFVDGLELRDDLSANVQVGFTSGLISPSGLLPPLFSVATFVNGGSTEYTVTAMITPLGSNPPPIADILVAVRIVGFDGWIDGVNLTTDANGMATSDPFPNGEVLDVVHGVIPGSGGPESQSGVIVTFPSISP